MKCDHCADSVTDKTRRASGKPTDALSDKWLRLRDTLTAKHVDPIFCSRGLRAYGIQQDVPHLLFTSLMGSGLYGLQTPDSDVDTIAIAVAPFETYLENGFEAKNLITPYDISARVVLPSGKNAAESIDCSVWPPGYFARRLTNSPQILGLVYAEDHWGVQFSELGRDFMRFLRGHTLRRGVGWAYLGLAHNDIQAAQRTVQRQAKVDKLLHWLDTKIPVASLDTPCIDFDPIHNAPLTHDKASGVFRISVRDETLLTVPVGATLSDLRAETDRVNASLSHRGKTDKDYDYKAAYSAMRALIEGCQLFENEWIEYPFTGQDFEVLWRIKQGRAAWGYVEHHYAAYRGRLTALRESRDLPGSDKGALKDYVVNMLHTICVRSDWAKSSLD